MGYQYRGRNFDVSHEAEVAHAAAKFEYFREAERSIDAGPEVYQPQPIRKHRKVAACGTYAGWAKHAREHTPPCRPCLDAVALYQRNYRSRKGAA